MFCYQCEQAAKGEGCTVLGVCGKNAEVAALQDLLIYSLQGLSQVAVEGRKVGVSDRDINAFTCEAAFSTLTNVDFDPQRLVKLINQSVFLRDGLKAEVMAKGGKADFAAGPATFKPEATQEGLVKQAEAVGLKSYPAADADIMALKHTLLFGIKGVCAYADHARILGQEDEKVYAFVHEGLAAIASPDLALTDLLPLVLKCGEINLRAMELLDAGNTGRYGHPVPTKVPLGHKKGKASADIGVDVVNMSFYTDPWLYNCPNNPADSPEAQQEQRTIIVATQRAVIYARLHGVTLIAALGNEHTDLGNPTFDDTSPDYPPGAAYPRTVDNTCVDVPAETLGVTSVSAVGPSTRKAYYSNYGVEQTDVSAPGGDYRDFFGTPAYRTAGNLVLAPYPESLAWANGDLNPDGTPNNPFVVQDCQKSVCAYYQYLQGTSMAAPHAVGVAALIVSKYGVRDFRHPGGLTLPPVVTEFLLRRTATNTPCPDPRSFVYPDLPASYTANCDGTAKSNGFYGDGIVDALQAVSR